MRNETFVFLNKHSNNNNNNNNKNVHLLIIIRNCIERCQCITIKWWRWSSRPCGRCDPIRSLHHRDSNIRPRWEWGRAALCWANDCTLRPCRWDHTNWNARCNRSGRSYHWCYSRNSWLQKQIIFLKKKNKTKKINQINTPYCLRF